MQQLVTTAIVLARTNYGEADRIVTVLTPDYGKVRLMANGVRRIKSKLAGGIELFSTSQITFIRGRSEIGTLVSARLVRHFGAIAGNIERVQLGYDLIKQLHLATEDEAEPAYFALLEQTLEALDDAQNSVDLVRLWFSAQLLKLGGHTPNLHTDAQNHHLAAGAQYEFDFTAVAFAPQLQGRFTADHIKLLRLIFSGNQPRVLRQIAGYQTLLPAASGVVETMRRTFVRS